MNVTVQASVQSTEHHYLRRCNERETDMPIPNNRPTMWRLKAWLTWATAEQTYGIVPMTKRQRFFRWLFRTNTD